MTLLVPLALALLVWAWSRGGVKALPTGDLLAAAGAILALGMIGGGKPTAGVVLLALAGLWAAWRRRAPRGGRADAPRDPAGPREARALLGVAPDADGDAIRAAHRRLIARVHPDAGGSSALARRVNAARDTLLAELNRRGSEAS